MNWTFKFIIPKLPDSDEVIAEVLGHVKSHEEHVVVDVLGLDPPHPAHARGPVAAVVREVAHVMTAQTAQLIWQSGKNIKLTIYLINLTANVIIFIVSVDTVPMKVAHIKRLWITSFSSVPAQFIHSKLRNCLIKNKDRFCFKRVWPWAFDFSVLITFVRETAGRLQTIY